MRSSTPNLLLLLFLSVTTVCAQDVASSASASPTTSALQISNDGSCGSGLTCAGSLYGQCCSEHWFCGTGDAYCGAGCQAEYGVCAANPGPGPSPTADPATVTVEITKTITAFASGLYTTTKTITGAITRTVLTTATNVVSRTDVRTLTQTQTLTTTAVAVVSTSIIYSTSSIYVTKNLTQLVLETSTLTTIGCFPTASGGPSTVTVTSLPPAPSPTLTGSPATCRKWYQVQKGETCNTIASKNGVTLIEIMRLNPVGQVGRVPVCGNDPASVTGLCRVNCDALWSGYYLCLGV